MAIQRHNKSFYGRPRIHVMTLLDQTIRGSARTQKRRDALEDQYYLALSKLTSDDRRAIMKYMEETLALEGLTTFKLALEWFLGNGLDQRSFTKQFTALWGEEETYAYPQESGE